MAIVNRVTGANDEQASGEVLRQLVIAVREIQESQRVRIGLHWYLEENAAGNCVLIYGPTGAVKETWTP